MCLQGVLGQAGRAARVIYAQTDSIFVNFPHATAQEAVELGNLVSHLSREHTNELVRRQQCLATSMAETYFVLSFLSAFPGRTDDHYSLLQAADGAEVSWMRGF